ncbi:MAG TPA: long-chain fatty acid--CoA ligase [Jatrophihabitans sp.]|nr:long-chain fatty acid--CoA ligase [Jatrophihabitans sp.]
MAATFHSGERIDPSIIEGRAPHIARLLLDRVQATPAAEAFRYRADGDWISLDWQQTADAVERLAAGLIALGVRPGQRVALASGTRIEWILADLAILMAGAATTTVYPTTHAEEMAYILADSGSVVVFAEDHDQLAKLHLHRNSLPAVTTVILLDGTADGDWVIGLDEVRELGAVLLRQRPGAVMERVAGIQAQDLATLIYTSGTTGRPKGVRLRHSALTYEAATVAAVGELSAADLQYLWLPLAHVFGNLLIMLPLQIGFATAVDGSIENIMPNLAVVRPTWMGAVPRIFEKVYAGVTGAIAAEGWAKRQLFGWAVRVGGHVARVRRNGQDVSSVLAGQYAIADRLVLSKVRARFGGRLRFLSSGSAPLDPKIAEWFAAIGIPVLEGYGLTETSAASLCNRLDRYVFGTVGTPFPGTEVRLAEDGEILLRGPGVMEGYHNQPEATAAVLGPDGWLATGDIGEFDEHGYLRITDRKKDLFKTSGGKYVAPAAVESAFRALCPYIGNIAVFGAGRNYATALITLDRDAITRWAAEHELADRSYAELARQPEVRELVQGYLDLLNERLNRWETVKRFVLLDREFTIADGELTPSLKLRRRVVGERHAELIDAMYA